MVEYIDGKRVIEGYTEGARVHNSGTIAISNTTWGDLTFDSERYDTDSIHDTSSNTDRLTCKTAGKYIIVGNVRWAVNVTGIRRIAIYLNGTTLIAEVGEEAYNDNMYMSVSTIYDLSVNDYVTSRVYQNSGGSLNVDLQANITPEFSMQRIG